MYEEIGHALRNYRKEKGLSIYQLSTPIVSPSFLSRVERGESSISIDRLFSILDSLRVTVTEFVNQTGLGTYQDFTDTYNQLAKYYAQNSIDHLTSILLAQRLLFSKTSAEIHNHLSIIAESMIADLTGTKLNILDAQTLRNYLFSVESWNKYELILFSSTVGQLPESLIISFGDALVKNVKNKSVLTLFEDLIESSFSNIVFILLQKDKILAATHFLTELDSLLSNSTHFDAINKLHYLNGLIKIANHDKENGVALATQAVEIITILGDSNVAADYRNYLESFLADHQ